MSGKDTGPRLRSHKPGFALEMKRNWGYYIMIIPAALLLLAFAYVPLPGLIVAFQNFNVIDVFRSPWVGLDNFRFFFASGTAWKTTSTTIWLNFNYLLWTNVISIAFAIMLNELRVRWAKKFYQNAMFLPYFFSVVIVAHLVIRVVFPDDMGIVNQIIVFFGGEPIAWSQEPRAWPTIIVSTHVWRMAGYQSIIYLSTITGIDEGLFEAAAIDGASRPKQILYITLPMLVPTIIILALLSIGSMLRGDFGLIYNLTSGVDRPQLLEFTDIIDTYVFRAIRGRNINFSLAAAVGLYQSVVGFMLVAGSNWLVKRYDKDYALF